MTHFSLILLWVILSYTFSFSDKSDPVITIHGSGWVEVGRIMHSTDTTDYYHQSAPIRRTFGHITSVADLGENWEGALGIGAAITHESAGRVNEAGKLRLELEPYIKEARFTYFLNGKENSPFKLTSGYFSYNYNPDVRNLGLYLLRGPVYPGILFSGFESKEISTIIDGQDVNSRAHLLGMHIENSIGPFSHHALLFSETELKPVFDYSLAYIAQFSFGDVFQIGTGINFSHLFAIQPSLTDLDQELWEEIETSNTEHPWDRKYVYLDTVRIDTLQDILGNDSLAYTFDTTRLSHRGIKTVGFFSLDLKPLLNSDQFGANELKFYGEIGIIGLNSFNGVYGTLKERMPIMFGANLPTWKLLDNFSVEVEWYGARFRDDYRSLMNNLSPLPLSNNKLNRTVNAQGDSIQISGIWYPNEDPYNINSMVKDNWKWSIHASKTIQNHLRISGQLANDHFRFKTNAEGAAIYESVFSTLDDWYWMLKFSYFF